MKFITTMAAALCAVTMPAMAETIRIGHATPEDSPIHKALLQFKQTVEDRSEGDITVEIFPGGQIGSVQEMVELVQSGNITMTTGASVHLSATVPELGVLDQFLLFDDETHARTVLDGPAGDALGAAMESRDLHLVGFMELGFRSFTNSRAPLDSLAAFEGLRMRSADNPVQIKAWRAIGAVPVPLAWGEIYSSLQQGLIDGQESALSSMIVERFFEVQEYVSLTGHIYWPELWMANADWYAGLSEAEREIIDTAAQETVTLQRELTAEANAATLAKLEEAGLAVNELPAEDRAEMGAMMNAAIEADIRGKVGDAVYDQFMSALQ
ncbi:TRAP transporter substrate-binding protein [Salipiger marinus]|uniref:TRAP transporter substrate-binding protein n=1 Tax=Salipiger marinus TaxID=555512 RepID=UPI002C9B6F01|nr:TRAP transporter substrate-binding protein [Salipiger manganoxidans]MEB3419850.1 TRAP transporter substrate-binding protein [Salipiger manganoxidans]